MKGEKIMKKYILLTILTAVLFSSCADSFLDRYPQGGVILQDQYEKLDNTLEGTLYGIYTLLYAVSDHDAFGKRSIDMYTDLLSGDMALTAENYGWFSYDEKQRGYTTRTGYLWGYYYDILHNINIVIRLVNAQSDVLTKLSTYGEPTDGLKVLDKDGKVVYTYTEAEVNIINYYAQALAMRGYVFSNLAMLYAPMPEDIFKKGNRLDAVLCVPIYTEKNMDEPSGRAYLSEVYKRAILDLESSVKYFKAFGDYIVPTAGKLDVDINIARGILAYTYLNRANPLVKGADEYKLALQYADEVIKEGGYTILPNEKLTTDGFNNIANSSWIWAQDVTVENYGGLASFFGQVDIHSYSYAWSGDTKVIDENLYKAIPTWDGRKLWFNDGSKNANFKLCPDGKFFSAKNPTSTEADDLDREWLSDNVFMRIESMYLIAAEAAYRLDSLAAAEAYLLALTDERQNLENPDPAAYETYKATLKTSDGLLEALKYNWRVEMWGEGYGLQTFRRLVKEIQARGGNHLFEPGGKMDSQGPKFIFNIPGSELLYNPYIDKNEE